MLEWGDAVGFAVWELLFVVVWFEMGDVVAFITSFLWREVGRWVDEAFLEGLDPVRYRSRAVFR